MKKSGLLTVLLLLCITLPIGSTPVSGYTYLSSGKAVEAPLIYSVRNVIYPGEDAEYEDIFYYSDSLYVLDSLNGRIEKITSDGEKESVELYDESGEMWTLSSPTGLFISDRHILVAEGEYVSSFNRSTGVIEMLYTEPDDSLYDTTITYIPYRVLEDSAGNVYVLIKDFYYGAVLFSEDGDFLGFYGSNPLTLTAAQRIDQAWKKILNRTQRNSMERFVPVAYSSFDIDEDDFVYTVSEDVEEESLKIRRVSPTGSGLWDGRNLTFGDIIEDDESVEDLYSTSRFTDVCVEDDIIYALDSARGRIFLYDEEGRLVGAFGGMGTQRGTFSSPRSIECGDYLYVLDGNSSITVFEKTEYGSALISGMRLYNDGLYEEAVPYFEEVLRVFPSSELASLALGKALQDVDGKRSLELLGSSGDREEYSRVFESLRLSWAREKGGIVIIAVFILVVLYLIFHKKLERVKLPEACERHRNALLHPSDALWQMKRKKNFSFASSLSVIILWFLIEIVTYFATGYIFNDNESDDFNILLSFMSSMGLYILLVVVNWSVSTITDGNGTMKDIFCSLSYGVIPLISAKIIVLILSYILTSDEGVFRTYILLIGEIWMVLYWLVALSTIHEYTFSQTLKNAVLTIVGMAFVLFLLFLAVVLAEHTYSIFSIIVNEIRLRR